MPDAVPAPLVGQPFYVTDGGQVLEAEVNWQTVPDGAGWKMVPVDPPATLTAGCYYVLRPNADGVSVRVVRLLPEDGS